MFINISTLISKTTTTSQPTIHSPPSAI